MSLFSSLANLALPLAGGAMGAMMGSPSTAIAGAGLGSSIAGGIFGNEASAKQASINRQFQQDMSGTAHQREVADLRAAGLNPILSATGGQGASTPAGSTAQQSDVVTPGINSALSILRTLADTSKTIAETNSEKFRPILIQSQADNAYSGAALNDALEQKTFLEQKTEGFRMDYMRELANLTEQQKISEKLKQTLSRQEVLINKASVARALNEEKVDMTTYGKIMRYVDRFSKSASPFIPSSHIKLP